MAAFEKYGRTLRVYLHHRGQVTQLVDWYDGRPVASDPNISLHCAFKIRRSTNPQPHELELRVWGLSRDARETLVRAYDEAEAASLKQRTELELGRLRVDAGYADDAAAIFVGDLAPDGVKPEPENPGHVTVLRALDGRLPWKQRFVNKSAGKNVDVNTIRGIIAAGGDYMAGKDVDQAFAKNFPTLVKRKQGFPGLESGYAIFQDSRRANEDISTALNSKAFFQDGEIRYMSRDVALLDTAVVLSAQDGGLLLSAGPMGGNRYRAYTLMEHRLRPGRQVRLYDDQGRPIGVGVYRVEAMEATGTNADGPFNVELDLVPTALPPVTAAHRPYDGPEAVPVSED